MSPLGVLRAPLALTLQYKLLLTEFTSCPVGTIYQLKADTGVYML